MSDKSHRVCPVEMAGTLDNRFRRWLQNPLKILRPYVKEGMTVLDIGCGPGFFTIDMATLVGETGRVIASDLQEGMLRKLKGKIRGTRLEPRITLHKCEADRIGVSERIDFALAFYLVHEVPDPDDFFREIFSLLKPGGRLMVVEPPFHVTKSAFAETIRKAREIGLTPMETPRVFLSKTVVLKKT